MSAAPRILVIEDDDDLRMMMEVAVSVTEIDLVGSAATADAGIELAVEHEPDLVIMDVYLPDMDGIAATKIIKEKVPSTKVVGFTGRDARDLDSMLEAGATAVYEKTRFNELLRSVQDGEFD